MRSFLWRYLQPNRAEGESRAAIPVGRIPLSLVFSLLYMEKANPLGK